MRPIATAKEKRAQADRDQEQDFDRSKEGRDAAAEGHCRAVDKDRHRHGGERDQLQASEWNVQIWKSKEGLIQRALQQRIKKDGEPHRERSRRSAASNRKLRPTINESPGPAVSIAHDAVLARGAWKHREQFGIRQSPSERKQTSYQPNSQRNARRAHIARHHTRLQKHAGADDIGDVDCNCGSQAETTDELMVFSGFLHVIFCVILMKPDLTGSSRGFPPVLLRTPRALARPESDAWFSYSSLRLRRRLN